MKKTKIPAPVVEACPECGEVIHRVHIPAGGLMVLETELISLVTYKGEIVFGYRPHQLFCTTLKKAD